MKRIQAACLEQTIHFSVKDRPSPKEVAEITRTEFQHYLQQLQHSRTDVRILSEDVQADGSLIVRLKRQYNSYPTGAYLD